MFHMPSQIDRYEIKTLIAAGGMGSLYLARDTNPNTNRLVAVKLLLANLDSGDLRERFGREARALAALNHPNIVDIYDSGEFQGSPFIVMEYVRGETLAEKIKRRAPLSLSQQLKLMVELCSGLAHAHEAGIIHRDIKPANLMVDQYGRLKILDFGIARVSEGLTRMGVQVTQLNMRIGTPGYMSPEQIERGEIDRRSDIFAVGAVCYELISFREAFTGANTRQVENKVLQSQPERLTSLIPGLDPDIEQIINKALAKDPNDRYQDAAALEEAFERLRWRIGREPTPVPAPRLTPDPTPSRKSRDSRADVAYHKCLALYSEGAHDAARRFVIEALAEDPEHEDALAFVSQRFVPNLWTPAPRRVEPYTASGPTMLRTSTHPSGTMTADSAETVLSTSSYRGGSGARQPAAEGWNRYGKGVLIGGIAVAAVAIIGLAVLVGSWLWRPGGPVLTITKPEGGTISGRGIHCGTNGSDCTIQMTRGAFVDLQAEPDSGFTFAAFTGACAPHGRMTLMQPETCGATFTKIPEGPVVPKVQLTIVPPQGGTIIGDGITCGTMGTECQTEHAQGKLVTLKHLADPEFTFKGFTGECARTGETLMNKPHRCGALFVRDRPAGNSAAGAAAGGGAASGAGGLASSSGIRPRPGGGGVGVGGGVGSSAGGGPSGAGGDPTFTRDASHPGSAPEIDKDGRDVKEPAAPPSPEGIAKDDIQKLLEAYRKAYEARDVDRIKSLYPTASDRFTNGLKYAFKDFKSVEYKYTTPPEFVELNPALGQATVKIGALLTAESRGPKSPPQKQKILFTLQRQQGTWSIAQLEASPEK
jgi:serine/threonine protein kinase